MKCVAQKYISMTTESKKANDLLDVAQFLRWSHSMSAAVGLQVSAVHSTVHALCGVLSLILNPLLTSSSLTSFRDYIQYDLFPLITILPYTTSHCPTQAFRLISEVLLTEDPSCSGIIPSLDPRSTPNRPQESPVLPPRKGNDRLVSSGSLCNISLSDTSDLIVIRQICIVIFATIGMC